MKLNLGCDIDYRAGWVNLDNYGGKADVVHDLNVFPYPFEDGVFDYILASHVLEHLKDLPRVMKELWRICKKGAIIDIKVPYYNNYNAFRDLSHIRYFTWDSFSPMALGKSRERGGHCVGYFNKIFSYCDRKLVWATTNKPLLKYVSGFMNWLVNVNPGWIEKRIPYLITCESLHTKLRVEKEDKKSNEVSQSPLTDEKIFQSLKRSKKRGAMDPQKWKKERLGELKSSGLSWSR
jgi:SAM-dependent methyltransferase